MYHCIIASILLNASASLSSLAQSDMRTYLFPLLPKMKPGVMNTRASCSTRSVSCSASVEASGMRPLTNKPT